MRETPSITGVILAGGEARRMGSIDKGLVSFKGRAMIEHVLDRFSGQVDELLINANRELVQYGAYGYKVISDRLENYQGPLAGVDVALDYIGDGYLCVVACDMPMLPVDRVERLLDGLQKSGAEAAVAHDGDREQTACFLVSASCRKTVRD